MRPVDMPPTVLVVEDNPTNLKLVQAALGRHYRVLPAASAEEALDVLDREERPDLILMDLGLPGMNGIQLTRRLRADPTYSSLPIAALTAHAMPSDRAEALEAGCTAFITKPVNTRTIADEVARLIAAAEDQIPI